MNKIVSRRHIILSVIAIAIGGIILHFYQGWFTVQVKTYGGRYHEGIIGTPRFINPVLAQSNADRDLTKLVFGSLLNVKEDGSIEYQLAKDLSINENKTVYTLSLDPQAYFSDGTPITADDVVFTVDKMKSPLIKSPFFSRWNTVTVEPSGMYEVTFTLEQPYADFIYNLNMGILPKHLWEEVSDEEFAFNTYNIKPVSSGWFNVSEIKYTTDGSPEDFVLKPNPYASSKPFLAEITITAYDDTTALKQAYDRGEIDGAYGISPKDLKAKDADKTLTGVLPRSFGIFFNTQDNKETLDATTRKALSYAINRDVIVDQVFDGYATQTNNPLGTLSLDTYDTQKAMELLEEDHWSRGEDGLQYKTIDGKKTPLYFNLSLPNIEEVVAVAELIQKDLAAIGVTVNLRVYEQTELTNEVIRNRSYDALLFGYVFEKPSDIYAFWHSSQTNDPGLNISMYSNTKIDGLLSTIRKEGEGEEEQESFLQTWSKDTPTIFLYSPSYIYLLDNVFDIPLYLSHPSDRFDEVADWYLRTRHVWKFLVNSDEEVAEEPSK